MALVLGAGAYCEWLETAEILAVLGFSEGQFKSLAAQEINQETLTTSKNLLVTEPHQLAKLSQWLGDHPQRRVILLYSDLPLALMAIIAQSQLSVKEALGVWQHHLEQFQSFYRKHRAQTLLFELGQVITYPHKFLHICATEWAQELPSSLSKFQITSLVPDLELFVLAEQLLREQPELSKCLQYIRAMTWPLGTTIEKAESTVLSTYDQLDRMQTQRSMQLASQQKIATLTADFNEIKQENALTLEQFLLTQMDLEKQLLVKNEVKKQLTELQELFNKKEQEQIEKLQEQQNITERAQAQVVALTKKNNGLLQESQLVLEQLLLAQEELEQKIVVEHSLREELADLKVQVQSYKMDTSKRERQHATQITEKLHLLEKAQQKVTELTQLKEYYEQRLTTQIKFSKQAQDLSQENKLLLEQFFLVQEELEKHVQAESAVTKNTIEAQEAWQVADTSQGLVAASDLHTNIPNYTVSPRSFFERHSYKKAQRLARRKDRERAALIAKTPWFDANWYLEQYPDIAADPVQSKNPALHYIRMGGFEGRNPSPHFDSAFYLEANPDVAATGLNPLWHFLQNGQAEGRQPQP